MDPTGILTSILLFALVGVLTVAIALAIGSLLRAKVPSRRKLQPYECGEPPVGSAFVRFDLRFYVVALLFIVFDVEVAFLYPWADVYGKLISLRDQCRQVQQTDHFQPGTMSNVAGSLSGHAISKADTVGKAEMIPSLPLLTAGRHHAVSLETMNRLIVLVLGDLIVFFGVVLFAFAYLWQQGDLEWVRPARIRQLAKSGRQC